MRILRCGKDMRATRGLLCLCLWLSLLVGCGATKAADIFEAVRAGDAAKVRAQVQAEPKLASARTEDGNTPLHVAALEGDAAAAKALLEGGAEVGARGLREETPLHMAMYDGHREVAELLLAKGAEINAQSANGETPLHLASRKGHRELVELLLDHQALVDARDRQDTTPLQVAAAGGYKEIVQALLARGADPDARNKAGRNAKAAAAEASHWEIVAVLSLRVGDLGHAKRLEFEGATQFSAEALRRGLEDMSDFFEIAHPLAPRDAYLEAVERKLLIGYQHQGFLDARLWTRPEVKAGRVVMKLTEGPRYTCGVIKVAGAQKVPSSAIIERLTTPRPSAHASGRAYDFKDQAPTARAMNDTGPDLSELTEALWVKGAPAAGSEADLRRIRAVVTDTLRNRGLLMAKSGAQFVPDKATRVVELQVEVMEEGPFCAIDHVEVFGNRKNTTEAVLRYLELKQGIALTGDLVSKVEDRLWRSARFLDYKISLGSPDSTGRVPLRIQLAEYDQAPPLEGTFSALEQTVLRMREWLGQLDQSGEELVIKATGHQGKTSELEFVLSPVNGLALRVTSHPTGVSGEYGAVLQAKLVGVYSAGGKRQLRLPCLTQQVKGFLSVVALPAGPNEDPFNVTMGAGFGQPGEGTTRAPPYSFALSLPPVACLGLAHRLSFEDHQQGDELVCSNQSMEVKLDTKTGRIKEFRFTNPAEAGRAEARFEVGAFARLARRMEGGAANLPNAFDTNAPISSALAFVTEEALRSSYLESLLQSRLSSNVWAALPALLKQFNLANALIPLNRLEPRPVPAAEGAARFSIPEDTETGGLTTYDITALIGRWLLEHPEELTEPRGWPRTLLREAGLHLTRRNRYTEAALSEIYESNETGPLGYWATAELLERMQVPTARKFAARGMERLSLEDFQRDSRLLLSGDSVISQCLQKFIVSLADLNEQELEVLAGATSPALATCLRHCSQRLHGAKDRPVYEIIAPALDHYWQTELKGQVGASLRRQAVDTEAVFAKGLKLYRSEDMLSDYVQAARLFQEAAEGGQAGAQYYLGLCYEKGEGVPKDVSKALKWFQQAGRNGSVEAAMTLGDLYGDGLQVERDPFEAFIWYGVAAGEGHKVAKVLRDSLRRKLSLAQAAEGEKQTATLLDGIPTGASQAGTAAQRKSD